MLHSHSSNRGARKSPCVDIQSIEVTFMAQSCFAQALSLKQAYILGYDSVFEFTCFGTKVSVDILYDPLNGNVRNIIKNTKTRKYLKDIVKQTQGRTPKIREKHIYLRLRTNQKHINKSRLKHCFCNVPKLKQKSMLKSRHFVLNSVNGVTLYAHVHNNTFNPNLIFPIFFSILFLPFLFIFSQFTSSNFSFYHSS